MIFRPAALAFLAFSSIPAHAQLTSGPEVEWMERIRIVAASRVEEPAGQVPASVSVVERARIFREVAQDLRGLLRYEPGVTIENSPARFGLGNIAIRGLDGNRVQMTLDGIRLPESYRVGSFSNASRNALGPGLLKRVEIVRGPASAIHGSDALAGVVAFTTVDPASYLPGSQSSGGEAYAAYSQVDRGIGRGAVGAIRAGDSQLLAGWERQDGREARNEGDVGGTGATRTEPNPQNTRSESQLVKWVVPTRAARWTLAADRYARDVHTDVLSLNPQSSRTVSLLGEDRARRTRASIAALAFDVGALTRLEVTAYVQDSLTAQDTEEERANTTAVCLSAPGTVRCLREARFRFEQREAGLIAIGEAEPKWPWANHALAFGAEVSRLRSKESRDGRQTDLATGTVSGIVGGEPLPTRDFPTTDTDRLGVFVQDRMTTAAGRFTWIPGLRYDLYRLNPEPDALFRTAHPERGVEGLRDGQLSPRFGALFRPSERWTLTAVLSTGYRAPPAADLNLGLASLPAGYRVVPNPDLRPESSRGAEIGARYAGRSIELQVSAFHTRYDDLILSRAPLACPGDPNCVPGATGTFQSQNVSSARIRGLEARALWRFASQWSARAAYAYARGDDLERNAPLNTIEPARIVAGLAWDLAWGGLALHVTRSEKPSRVDFSRGVRFVPPAWTSVDLTGYWTIRKGVELSAGLFNLADRKYWHWSDVRGLTNVSGGFDRYTQPGRNFGANVRVRF